MSLVWSDLVRITIFWGVGVQNCICIFLTVGPRLGNLSTLYLYEYYAYIKFSACKWAYLVFAYVYSVLEYGCTNADIDPCWEETQVNIFSTKHNSFPASILTNFCKYPDKFGLLSLQNINLCILFNTKTILVEEQ